MITSRLTSRIFETRSVSFARPSGFRTDLSKSKKASAAKVTLEAATAGAAGGAAGAGAAGVTAAGAATGTMAPSQPAAAVAGVQLLLRQHSSLVPFFQTNSPVPFCQLSITGPPFA